MYHSLQQATLTRLLFEGRASLDYGSRLCWNMFSSSPQRSMAWRDDGLLTVRASGYAPPIIHYNGGISTAPLDWMVGFDAETLLRRVRQRTAAHAIAASRAKANRTVRSALAAARARSPALARSPAPARSPTRSPAFGKVKVR